MFIGRTAELQRLDHHLQQTRTTGRGTFLAVRGRRQVGKSTLLEEFITRSGAPALYFAASKGAPADRELVEFVHIAQAPGSGLTDAFNAVVPRDWSGALRLLSQSITEPVVVVIDEFPGWPVASQDWKAAGLVTAPDGDELRRRAAGGLDSPLVVVGERVLNAEFPPATQAREVVTAIGSGETTFSNLGRRTDINQGSLSRTLGALTRGLRVVAAERPLSAAPSRLSRYVINDNYLRFWLRFVAGHMELILRGRGALAAAEVAAAWPEHRGRAVEPLVRRSIERLLPDERFGATRHVGSYWTRIGDVEVDLIGSPDREAPADVTFVGSVTWRDRAPFSRADVLHLAAQRAAVPGADEAPLVGVARTEVSGEVDVALVAEDLLAAWR